MGLQQAKKNQIYLLQNYTATRLTLNMTNNKDWHTFHIYQD